jgi:hypothetical protein
MQPIIFAETLYLDHADNCMRYPEFINYSYSTSTPVGGKTVLAVGGTLVTFDKILSLCIVVACMNG